MNFLGSFDRFVVICDDAGIIISLFIYFFRLSVNIGGGGVQPHFCPSPNPDFDVSWAKMGKKYIEREGKSIGFNSLSAYYQILLSLFSAY